MVMVGWSRRAAESARMRREFNLWWNTLTPEQKAQYNLEEAARWKQERKGFLIAFAVLFVMLVSFYVMIVVLKENKENILLRAMLGSCEGQLGSLKARCQ